MGRGDVNEERKFFNKIHELSLSGNVEILGYLEGLEKLSNKIPIALDESIIEYPSLRNSWNSWQIRHPLLEGDPRLLLKELKEGAKYRVVQQIWFAFTPVLYSNWSCSEG